MKIHVIYKIINTINGKVYFGQTFRGITKRLKEHASTNSGCLKLHYAINKYGIKNFFIEDIASTKYQDEANRLENFFIQEYNSIVEGYNIKNGGTNGAHSDETKSKMSASHTGKIISNETREKMSLAKIGNQNYWYGKTRSEEDKNKCRISQLGELGNFWGKSHTEISKQKISNALKAKPKSEEHKKKLSIAKRGKYDGESNPSAKLSNDDAETIRQLISDGITVKELCKLYSVSKSTILRIKNGKSFNPNKN